MPLFAVKATELHTKCHMPIGLLKSTGTIFQLQILIQTESNWQHYKFHAKQLQFRHYQCQTTTQQLGSHVIYAIQVVTFEDNEK